MKVCRTLEFFEADNQRLSMRNLLKFAAFFPASVMAYKLNSVEALGVYLGAYVLDSLGGKWADRPRKADVPQVVSEGPTTVNLKGKK